MFESTKRNARQGTGRDALHASAPVNLLREIGVPALAGILFALLALVLFATLSEDVFSQEINGIDNGVSLWVHSFASPAFDVFFNIMSGVAGTIGIALLTVLAFALLYWRKQRHDAWRLVLVVIGGLIINQVLKLLFHRTRPDLWPGSHFAGFSFPSGHATLSFCLFGLFIWLGWRYITGSAARVGWTLLMGLLIAMVGLSRIYLGAHFLSDVIAGYLSAAVWLFAVLSGTDIMHRLRNGQNSE